MNRPLVTIFLPTHNRRLLLEKAISSVREQAYQSLEIVVVNDASTDETREFLDHLAREESRLVVIHSEIPLGAARARNLALRRARGEFATGLDDDDYFLPDRIQKFVSEWNELGPGLQISCLFTDSIMREQRRAVVTTDRKVEVNRSDLFRHNFIGNQIFCPTQRLLEIGGFDENLPALEDLELFMRLLERYGPAQRVSGATYVCNVDRNRQRMSNNEAKHYSAYQKIVEKNPAATSQQQAELFLQLFSPFYGTIPSASDWSHMLQLKAPPALLIKFLRATVRNNAVKLVDHLRNACKTPHQPR